MQNKIREQSSNDRSQKDWIADGFLKKLLGDHLLSELITPHPFPFNQH